MKRNAGLIIMLIAQVLKAVGANIEVSETDVDTIVTGIGAATATVGVLHDLYRKWKARKVKKQ